MAESNIKIRTRIFNYGDKCEAEWPPQFGTGDTTPMHINHETGKVEPGRPKPTPVHGKAPMYISDTIKPYYHPGVCKVTESRSELRAFDDACGTITTDKLQKVPESARRERETKRAKESREALLKAVAQIDNGTAPLTEEQRAACNKRNETIAAAMPGFDPFNAVGRISDERGRRYKAAKRKRSSK